MQQTVFHNRLAHLDTRVQEARAARKIAEARYGRGVLPLLQLLETERRLRLAENELVTAQGDSWGHRIDLYLALGGDWVADEATPIESTPPTRISRAQTSSEEES